MTVSRSEPVATAVLMSGSGTNAEKIIEHQNSSYTVKLIVSDDPDSRAQEIAHTYGIHYELVDIYEHFQTTKKMYLQNRSLLKDHEKRSVYDKKIYDVLLNHNIQLVAAAGYNWILSDILCDEFIIVNVHPGDLTVKKKNGKPRYTGLGWIPIAKAILNNEKTIRTSVHIVTAGVDEGPVARLSEPVELNVADHIQTAARTQKICITDIIQNSSDVQLYKDIKDHAEKMQNILKEQGDWIEFPRAIHQISSYIKSAELKKNRSGLYLNGRIVEDLFLMENKTWKKY